MKTIKLKLLIKQPTDSEQSSNLVTGVIGVISADLAGIILWFVVGYLLVGVGLLIVVAFKKRSQENDDTPSGKPNAEPKEITKPAEAPKPAPTRPANTKKPPTKIQL